MKSCSFCAGLLSLGNAELDIEIKLIGSRIRVAGYNQLGWKKEACFDVSFCPLCGRALDECKELEREE